MKKFIHIIIAMTLFALFQVPVFSQEDMTEIDNQAFKNPQRPPSAFVHDEHNENAGVDDCSVCHHVYDENKQLVEYESSEDQSCSDCHSEKATSANGMPLMRAFHTNCKNCHEAEKKGPVMCGECHVKKKKL